MSIFQRFTRRFHHCSGCYLLFSFSIFRQQKQDVLREQQALKQREKQLNEQQKQQIKEIDDKLCQLRNERERLAGNQQQLSPGQQQQLQDLQAKRRDILGTEQAPASVFPSIPQTRESFSSQNVPQSYGSHQAPQMTQPATLRAQNHGEGHFNTMQAGQQQFSPYGSGAPSNYSGSPSQANSNQMREDTSLTRSAPQAYAQAGSFNAARDENPEIQAWKKEQEALQSWQQQSTNLQESHQEKLQRQEREYMQSLQQREEALRSQWTQELTQQQVQVEQERSQVHQELTDDMLCRMTEAELRMWMNHAQKNQFIDEMLARRQRLLDEQAWLLQQDLENKNMALSFREDDLRKKEWEIKQQREAERRALARVFCIIVETTNPEGKRTGKTYQMQVRAGDSLFRICERIPHDKELFCVRMDYNGKLLEDLDQNLLDLQIPDNAFMIARLLPKADVDVLNLIPCEDCGKRFHAEVFAAHKCMKQFSQELPSARRSANPRTTVARQSQTRQQQPTRVVRAQPKTQEVIPCEYCGGLFPTTRYDSHTRSCSERKSVPRVTRYRYY